MEDLKIESTEGTAVAEAPQRGFWHKLFGTQPNDGDVVGILELHIEPVAAPLDPVGRENARLGRVDQKVLVVIRSVLCNRADRSSHTCSEALLSVPLPRLRSWSVESRR